MKGRWRSCPLEVPGTGFGRLGEATNPLDVEGRIGS